MAKRKKKKGFFSKLIRLIIITVFLVGGVVSYFLYGILLSPNVDLKNKAEIFIYIPSSATFDDVIKILSKKEILINEGSFIKASEIKKYKNKVKSGKYLIHNGLNNWNLVNLLRSGEQKPVKVVLNNIRLKEDLCRKVGKQIEADSTVLLSMLNDKYYLRKYNLTTESVMAIFIPNTYEFYWTTSSEQFFERMANEYKKFWTTQRKKKAKLIGFTPLEVSVMASIIQKETAKNDEKARIAGVYMNRYKKDWKLQADPTVIFAVQDFTIRRVLKQHLKFDSPYNTYIYTGLPPGPICAPSISSIDAVLNYEDHNYMYFCAKEDFSGYHNFAKTYSQHKVNARKYRKAFKNRNKS